jgi:large subunit ribosomal protein L16
MLQPKRRKYRKEFRGRMRGVSAKASEIVFGEYALKAIERGWLTSNQIEAGRRAITHSLKKGGKLWIRVFPDKPVTARAAGQRMGGGKGDIILYEVVGMSEEVVRDAFEKVSAKMPFKTKMIKKE